MGKRVSTTVLDQALNYLKNNVTRQCACSAEPTTYTEAITTYKLADVTLASGDFTVANGDGAGTTPRKVTIGSKSDTVDSSGTATHVALVDVTNTTLLEVTTCTSQALTASNPITFPAWKIEIGAPT